MIKMPRPSAKRTTAFHWIPPESSAAFKLTVTRSDSTIDDISNNIHMFKIQSNKSINSAK